MPVNQTSSSDSKSFKENNAPKDSSINFRISTVGDTVKSLANDIILGALGGGVAVAVTALPFINKYADVANSGMLGKAIKYGAAGGAIAQVVIPRTGLWLVGGLAGASVGGLAGASVGGLAGAVGGLTTADVNLTKKESEKTIKLSSLIGAVLGGCIGIFCMHTALTGFTTGYFAKTLAPEAFKDDAVKVGLKVLKAKMVIDCIKLASDITSNILFTETNEK